MAISVQFRSTLAHIQVKQTQIAEYTIDP
jgi:hypothetical protein